VKAHLQFNESDRTLLAPEIGEPDHKCT